MKKNLFYLMALFYLAAGINHFLHTAFYLRMMPPLFANPLLWVYVSGVLEIIFGIGLLFPATIQMAAWGIIILLIVIFPANIYMAIHASDWHFSSVGLWLRLPLQPLLIFWAYCYTKLGWKRVK